MRYNENYEIIQSTMTDAQTATVTISLTWKTSGDDVIPAESEIHMTKDEDNHWIITQIE